MATDWYRNDAWTPHISAEFERRLARARAHNRPEYLRVQGVHLQRAGHIEAAREMWVRVLDQPIDKADVGGYSRAGALEHLADSYAQSDPPTAERWYRRLLSERPDLQCTSQQVELSLAEVLVAQANPAAARQALQAWRDRGGSHTPEDLLRAHIVLVDIAVADGDQRAARHAARGALQAADLPAPFFNHPQVGVAHLDPETHARLRRLARRLWLPAMFRR